MIECRTINYFQLRRSVINFERELNRSPETRQRKQRNLCLSTCLWNHNATSANNRASWISSRVWHGVKQFNANGRIAIVSVQEREAISAQFHDYTHKRSGGEGLRGPPCSHSRRHLRITTRATRFSQSVTLPRSPCIPTSSLKRLLSRTNLFA